MLGKLPLDHEKNYCHMFWVPRVSVPKFALKLAFFQLSIQLSPATHRDSLTTEGVKTGRKSQSLQFLVEILMED